VSVGGMQGLLKDGEESKDTPRPGFWLQFTTLLERATKQRRGELYTMVSMSPSPPSRFMP
jgi:hypothetical protein